MRAGAWSVVRWSVVVGGALAALAPAGVSANQLARADGSALPALNAHPGAELPSLRTRTTQTFEAKGGSYELRMATESINYRDATGRWQPIDNTLRVDGDTLRNGANRYQLAVPRRLGAGSVRVSAGGAWVEFAPAGVRAKAALARGGRASFAGAWPGVELRYTATGDTVKEALVVRDRSYIQDFAFDLRVPMSHRLEQEPGGSIAVRDAQGNVPLRLSRATMADAAGAKTNTPMRLRKTLTGWRLVIVPDRAWLDRPERKWPVTIDPTVTVGVPPALACLIWDNGGYTGGSCDEPVYASSWTDRDTGRRIWDYAALVRFDLAGVLPPGAVIEFATIDLRANPQPWWPPYALFYGVVGESWNHNVTWTTRDGTTPWSGAGGGGAADQSNVTQLVRRWHTGEQPNYGISVYSPLDTGGFSLDPVLSIQYAPTDDPDGLQDIAASWYAAKYGVTLEEAKRRLALQDRVDNIENDIEAAIASADFGGIWFEPADGGRAKIGIETDQPAPPEPKIAAARQVLVNHNLQNDVDFVAVRSSLDDLVSAHAGFDSSLGDLYAARKLVSSIKPQFNAITVDKANSLTAAQETQLSNAVAGAGVNVSVTATNQPVVGGENDACAEVNGALSCTTPLRGGVRLDPVCTAGFYATGRSGEETAGKHYVLTAGHCINGRANVEWRAFGNNGDAFVIGPSRRFFENKTADAGLIEIRTSSRWYESDPPAYVYQDESNANGVPTARQELHAIKRVRLSSRIKGRRLVCQTSKLRLPNSDDERDRFTQCGEIEGFDGKHGGTNGLAEVEFCGRDGASGGPVYKNNVAYGLWQGTEEWPVLGCRRGFFQGIREAEELLKVNVATIR